MNFNETKFNFIDFSYISNLDKSIARNYFSRSIMNFLILDLLNETETTLMNSPQIKSYLDVINNPNFLVKFSPVVLEKVKFLKNLNQGSLTLKDTKIMSTNIFSGKNIRCFGYIEQFFVMLSLGIFFVTKVKNIKLKKNFFKLVKTLIVDFNTRNSPKLTVRFHKKNFKLSTWTISEL